ncbi:iron-containing alcohol dehydrogenase family protein [Nodularia harveyana UHCC-0300]|uniref:Iron-containing alcohol dehydrogenase family protein n=1 Tax=Nodularia harveyana UHCC-0300 TaxID=2974287 RepID=A0ABU5UGX5_9CYAN|nr:iron-containing alcohol dehydrogenase family protein [Nodularia harveyana]MEA5582231.1 iron-containing alcohol dehydrogenase family protein [Nodularia harveyana UHCC-0300]
MPNQFSPKTVSTETSSSLLTLTVAPGKIIRGAGVLQSVSAEISRLGSRPLIIAGNSTLAIAQKSLQAIFAESNWHTAHANYGADCCEASLEALRNTAQEHQADVIIGVGGGKALDTAKLVAHQLQLPVVTIPTSAATCAAWTALSNVYSPSGAFLYDVALSHCPDLLILDYDLIQTAPQHTLVAGIGDAIAKWYEASVSSGNSQQTLIISAVQQARVLRDILLQKSTTALKEPGSADWREVVDATVLLAGVIGGLGGAQCRTVAAHAVHNGLTHISGHSSIHGEKVAYGILVQLRLEEMLQSNQLAASARQQLLKFYAEIGLPRNLDDLGLGNITLGELQTSAEIALDPKSDIHRLPFKVAMEQLMAAMVSTTAPTDSRDVINRVSTRGMSEEVLE